ncbi:MAG TPA: hypothetical protein VEF71_24590 [Streptosporangiaceae bacterium]|nr:hypothetical protein [Streptosporangiaceae bacterium]
MPGEWQVRFDGGRQQRYLADRTAVLRYVLAVGPHAAGPRFEVFAEAGPVRLADGSDGGRQFTLVEVIDLSHPGEAERLRAELRPPYPWPPYPYQLRLPLAPYRFVWRDEAAVDAEKSATDSYTEERYRHADGSCTVIREYRADGSYHIMSDRGEIELIDNANDPYAPDPVSVVRLA